MSTSRRILVIGATGKVGSAIVETLSQHNSVELVAAVRKESSRQQFSRSGIETVKFDFDDLESIQKALVGVQSLLLLTGYTVDMLKHSKRVVDSAKNAGVKHIVHIGASGNETSEVAHWGWHRMVEAYIEQQGFDYTHLQPEAFMQNLTAFGWLNQHKLTNLIGNATWSWIDATDVGALAAQALIKPDEFRNQTWRLGYNKASMYEVAYMLAATLGFEIKIQNMDPNEFYTNAVDAGAEPTYMACVRDQFILNAENKIDHVDLTFDTQAFAQAVGRQPIDWHQHLIEQFKILKQCAKAA